MAENQNGAEKTELPTPKRILDARDEGQVAYSPEIGSAVLVLGGTAILVATGPWFVRAVADSLRYACGEGLRVELDPLTSVRELIIHHLPLAWWLLPLAGGLFAAGVLASVMQVGFYASAKSLVPKWEKLNPVSGAKRLFGLRGWVRLILGLAKLAALTAIGWLVIAHELPAFVQVPHDLGARLARDAWLLALLAFAVGGALAVIAIVDLLYQRWQHLRDLMMTRQELKEEFKQSEGDPHLRARVRQLQREVAGRRMMQEVPKADVVITNPTHVAVALRYRQGRDQAPVVVAKGYDAIAQRIKAIAAEHGIPLVEDVPLARALAREAHLGRAIPAHWYTAVARILAGLMRARAVEGPAPRPAAAKPLVAAPPAR